MTFLNGGELVARTLAAQGVTTIYTLCGGHVAPIYDGCLNNAIAIIDFRHEQAAAHAADAHARLTRSVGVAVVTAGPGVTDAVTAVANAYQARSPLLLIGGAAPIATRGKGALQEMPQTDMFRAFTKASFTIERTEDIPAKLHEAFVAALSSRPGPVFVELPVDVLFNTTEPSTIPARYTPDPVAPTLDVVQAMFDILRSAKRPVLVAGTQVTWDDASAALHDFTNATAIPVYTNGGGRGALPMNHPHCFKASRSKALRQADVIVLIGTPLDFRLKYGEDWRADAKLIQIDDDPAELGRNRRADVASSANARLILEALSEGLQGLRFDDWLEQVRILEQAYRDDLARWKAIDDQPINHFRFAAGIEEVVDDNTILIGDGGDIVSACAKVLDVNVPGAWMDPGPLGCLGVGLPFAIAAKHLYPHKKVLVINGDGAFGLNGFEFDTAVRFNLPIVSIVGNDAGWGQIRTPVQAMMGEDRAPATHLALTHYERVVEALGGMGEYVTDPAEIAPALRRAFASGRPACVNVVIDPKGMSKTGASTPYIF
ncbi:MAG: thiamine pyrophosphate-binding protein [Anaerolineae bacterium]|nr:thiamine pyrophosphate-binding protein [Anaerolineae bacterium]MDW8172752.1 thiamine pyrophosphate-binding protein [Anaerolineae bacterium]